MGFFTRAGRVFLVGLLCVCFFFKIYSFPDCQIDALLERYELPVNDENRALFAAAIRSVVERSVRAVDNSVDLSKRISLALDDCMHDAAFVKKLKQSNGWFKKEYLVVAFAVVVVVAVWLYYNGMKTASKNKVDDKQVCIKKAPEISEEYIRDIVGPEESCEEIPHVSGLPVEPKKIATELVLYSNGGDPAVNPEKQKFESMLVELKVREIDSVLQKREIDALVRKEQAKIAEIRRLNQVVEDDRDEIGILQEKRCNDVKEVAIAALAHQSGQKGGMPWGNVISTAGSTALAGFAFGPVGAVVAGIAGLIGGAVAK